MRMTWKDFILFWLAIAVVVLTAIAIDQHSKFVAAQQQAARYAEECGDRSDAPQR